MIAYNREVRSPFGTDLSQDDLSGVDPDSQGQAAVKVLILPDFYLYFQGRQAGMSLFLIP